MKYQNISCCLSKPPSCALKRLLHCALGRWVEDHGVVHNIMFNATTNSKVLYKQALKRSEWWDNGALPLWITAQNQVRDSVVLLEFQQQDVSSLEQ